MKSGERDNPSHTESTTNDQEKLKEELEKLSKIEWLKDIEEFKRITLTDHEKQPIGTAAFMVKDQALRLVVIMNPGHDNGGIIAKGIIGDLDTLLIAKTNINTVFYENCATRDVEIFTGDEYTVDQSNEEYSRLRKEIVIESKTQG